VVTLLSANGTPTSIAPRVRALVMERFQLFSISVSCT
jgi:hypothetical protein